MTREFDFEQRMESYEAQIAEEAAKAVAVASDKKYSMPSLATIQARLDAEKRSKTKAKAESISELANRYITWTRTTGIPPNNSTNYIVKPERTEFRHGLLCGIRFLNISCEKVIEREITSQVTLWNIATKRYDWESYESYENASHGETWQTSGPHSNDRQVEYCIGRDHSQRPNSTGIYVAEKGSGRDYRPTYDSYYNSFFDQKKLLAGGSKVDSLLEEVTPDMILNRVAQLAVQYSLDPSKF